MADYCRNRWDIYGDPDRVKECFDLLTIKDKSGALRVTFEKALPIPDGLDDETEWTDDNWGTSDPRWNNAECTIKGGLASLRFDSAWCPPEEFFAALAQMFPDLSLEGEWWAPHAGTSGLFCSGADSSSVQVGP